MSFGLANGDNTRRFECDKMALSNEQSRQRHNVPLSATTPPSVVITDLSQNDVKVFSSDTSFRQTDASMDSSSSGRVRQSGGRTRNTPMPSHGRTGHTSLPLHGVRWSDMLGNSSDDHGIWKVRFFKHSSTYICRQWHLSSVKLELVYVGFM